jgi:tRNA pseudouridine13 synthase
MTNTAERPRSLPHEPPLVTRDLLPIGGRIGPALEDFQVEEIPAYLPCGQGDHRYVCVEKRGLSTPELVSLIARTAGAPERDIGTAGLKDKHAVTTQWLSLPKRSRPANQWELPETVRVLEENFHNNKLRTGHLHGNRFRICLVELHPNADQRLPALVGRIRHGVLNAFAEQRFGRDGQNIQAALEWLKDPRQLRGPKARFLSKLYPSVIQSELFNRYLTLRLSAGTTRILAGEVVRLEGSGATFVVEDLAAEQLRFERGELQPQGPMFGPKMRPANDAALALEEQVKSELGLDGGELDRLSHCAPGTRRDVFLRPTEFNAVVEERPAADPSGMPELVARLTFTLPAGSYATHLVRELAQGAWFEPKARSPAGLRSPKVSPESAP